MCDPDDPNPADSPPETRVITGVHEKDYGWFMDVNDRGCIWCIAKKDGNITCGFPYDHCLSPDAFRCIEVRDGVVTEVWGRPGEQENTIPLGVLHPDIPPQAVYEWDARIKEIIKESSYGRTANQSE